MTPGWRVWVHEKGHASVGGTIVTMAAPDFNAAKAAAQSNYERRIRSALDIVSASSFADGIDAERQKREAAEREIVSLRSEIDCYETEKEDLESEFTKAEEYHASSLAKANARIAEQDRAIARLQANNSSMAWTKMLARITELEKALIVERQRWWQPEYPDQAKPVLAVWFDHESEHGLSGFDNAADLDAFQAGAHGPFLRRVTGNEYR
jgi:predicted RNase H-like nuclease (RuvC/YqgF family)